jgi:D-arabinose 1-dehydrogenase-like Zn-dependent alcohol dehydrogenase
MMPERLTPVAVAPLMCAGLTVYTALKRCALGLGKRVGIMRYGGGLGHLGLQFATKMGLKILGMDVADGPLKLAKGLETGAGVVDARKESVNEVLLQPGAEDGKLERGEIRLDAVVILPENRRAFDYGVRLLRNHGKCIVV